MRLYTIFSLTGFAGVVTLASVLAIVPASTAGQANPSDGGQAQDESSQENCQAKPNNKQPNEKNDQTGSITKKLDKCGGVLQPPDVNDPGLVKPAPDTGEMPVIKPNQMPEQAPKQK